MLPASIGIRGWLPGPYIISFSLFAIVLGLSHELASEAGLASDYVRRVATVERDLQRRSVMRHAA